MGVLTAGAVSMGLMSAGQSSMGLMDHGEHGEMDIQTPNEMDR